MHGPGYPLVRRPIQTRGQLAGRQRRQRNATIRCVLRYPFCGIWLSEFLASINHKFPKKGPKCPRNQNYSQFEIGRSSKSITDTVSGYHYPVVAVKHAAPFRQVIHVK